MTTSDLYRIAFPYCVQKQDDGSYVLLNRMYKPIGFWVTEHLRNEDYPVSIRFKGLKESKIRRISVDGDPNDVAIYLYGDGSKPTANEKNMKDYLKRLSILMSLEVQ